MFAGPGVAGAIRNQLSQVENTVDAGTDGDNFMSAEEKAYREAMKTVAQKEAKDWTLDEQKAAATDIAKNGTSSVVYAKAEAAMKAGTAWSVKLTNGQIVTYRIIGINHDDAADGSGKAGLTFESTIRAWPSQPMNSKNTNAGGWENSELRSRLNTGDLWALLPSELQSKVKAVVKMTDNKGGGSAGTASATTDKVFLLSSTEVWGDLDGDGTQYEYYAFKGVTASSHTGAALGNVRWTRSVNPKSTWSFRYISSGGGVAGEWAKETTDAYPVWCF